ncbi:MAG TPA: energy-coupled thiamine transporter ThiT [Bacillota bacterium]|nr:energy-coupled thiamine transporter ThiT [Bacillota bacterium]
MLGKTLSHLTTIFEKFKELSPTTVAVIIVLFIVGIGGLILMKKGKEVKFTTRMLVMASLCIALSFVLSYIRLFRMPQSGSITPASMLPLILFAVIYGPIPGVFAGMAYGILQYFQGGFVVHWIQFIIDFPLAFGLLGLAGLYRKNMVFSTFIAIFARFLMHFLAGVVFFSEITQASDIMPSIWFSLTYNGTYLGIEFLISAFILMLPPIKKMISHLRNAYGDAAIH